MEQVLLVVQVLIAIGLIGMVLIQRSDSDGFGLGGGSGNNLLSGRSTANLMTRTTAILAALFLINSLVLSVIAARGHKSSIIETIEEQQPSVPAVPLAGAEKGDAKSAPKESVKKDIKPDEKVAPKTPSDANDKLPIEKKVDAAVSDTKDAANEAAPEVKKAVKKAAQPAFDPNAINE